MNILPIILSGGVGSRLWPLSREQFPKQCLPLTDSTLSLLQQTIRRIQGLDNVISPLVVCNEDHRFLIAQQLQDLDLCGVKILLEPFGRNTAPAIALAAFESLLGDQNEEDTLLLVLPADHVIKDIESFERSVKEAVKLAKEDSLVTFGIKPTRPETGYGYIKSTQNNIVDVFVEKPNIKDAQKFYDSTDYLWNSGMFMFKASAYLTELNKYRSDIYLATQKAFKERNCDLDFIRIGREYFKGCPSESIDYAVMEKTEFARVVPYTGDWSDIGAWDALYDYSEKDSQDNVLSGDVLVENTSSSYIRSESRLISAVGVKDLIIIETADAILVMDKKHSQDVKRIVDKIKLMNRNEHSIHTVVHRPWGTYQTIDLGDRYQVKRIMVKPGEKLSVQMHHHRAEHWVVVTGTAKVKNGERDVLLTENESTYIPVGVVHALENPGKIPLELIEVQSGAYLEEDDIVRFSDRYGRDKV